MCVTFHYVLIGLSMMNFFHSERVKKHIFRPEKYKLAPFSVTENRGGTERDRLNVFDGKKMTTGRDGRVK